jgi:RNase P/RNase MRP subunit POP5
MLRRRNKRRYLAILYKLDLSLAELRREIEQRFTELFGSLALEFAYVRSYSSKYQGILILGCDLNYIEQILFTIAVLHHPMTAIAMSGTLRRLRKGLDKLNYNLNA